MRPESQEGGQLFRRRDLAVESRDDLSPSVSVDIAMTTGWSMLTQKGDFLIGKAMLVKLDYQVLVRQGRPGIFNESFACNS